MSTENELLIIVIGAIIKCCCYSIKVHGKRPKEDFLFENLKGLCQQHYS